MTHHTFKKLFLFSLLQVFFKAKKQMENISQQNAEDATTQSKKHSNLIPSKIFSLFLSSNLPVHEIDLELCIPASNHKTQNSFGYLTLTTALSNTDRNWRKNPHLKYTLVSKQSKQRLPRPLSLLVATLPFVSTEKSFQLPFNFLHENTFLYSSSKHSATLK